LPYSICLLIGAFLGNQVIDSVVAAEAAQRDAALERALAEVESLQSRLEEAERHTEQFRLIGSSTEMMLRELRDRSATSKEAQELELSK
jgi:predicted  nucleic acid-binding Zn-ribbon protein